LIVTLEEEVLVEVVLTGLLVEVDLEEEIEKGEVLVDLIEEIEVQKGMRCIQLYVINAAKIVKFPSGQPKENLSTVMIVLNQEAEKPVQDQKWENQITMNPLTSSTKKLDRILKILEDPIMVKEDQVEQQSELKKVKKIKQEEPKLEYAEDIEKKKPKKKKAKKKK